MALTDNPGYDRRQALRQYARPKRSPQSRGPALPVFEQKIVGSRRMPKTLSPTAFLRLYDLRSDWARHHAGPDMGIT